MNRIRDKMLLGVLLLLTACGTVPVATVAEDQGPSDPVGVEESTAEELSLDALLLESLDDELLEGIDDLQRQPSPPSDADSLIERPSQLPSELDMQLLDQLGDGEDIGQGPGNPLVAIGRQMRVAEELIGRRVTSDRTQRIQGQIVADLDELIEQLKAQCQSGQCDDSGGGTQKPDSERGGQKQGGAGENRGDSQPARESAERVGDSQADSAELDRMKRMLKHVWGHLPAKVREQMQSGAIEEFLPKYEKLIEDYYSRLAKEEI